MNKGKVARIAGFIGALGASALLVGTAVQGTGAYFTDSANGSLTGSSGSLQISATNTTLNFSGLNPGQDRSQSIGFTVSATSTTAADVWLVFDTTSAAYGAFTGANGVDYNGYTGGGLGGYGHLKVAGHQGTFESYNLALPNAAAAAGGYTSSGSQNTCTVDANGLGGSAAQHQVGHGNDLAQCGVPGAVLLWSNLQPGATGASATITFGLTGKQTNQNQANEPNVPFKIVATQPGQRPGSSGW